MIKDSDYILKKTGATALAAGETAALAATQEMTTEETQPAQAA